MKVLFVVGPTGSGKSAVALRIARKYQGEILNADSLQVYQELNIGTAKPSREEMKVVRHHLFDIVPAGGSFTAADFRRRALVQLDDCQSRNVPVVCVVGGSGFYIQALVRGMFEAPPAPDFIKMQIAKDLKERGAPELHKDLEAADPASAKRIHPNDAYRIQRALELVAIQARAPSQIREEFKPQLFPFECLNVAASRPRAELRTMIEKRTEQMLKNGFIREVADLRHKVLNDWAPLKSVGYREITAFLDGEMSENDLLGRISQSTMQLAKRQMTWFKRDPETQWFHPDVDAEKLDHLIRSFLERL